MIDWPAIGVTAGVLIPVTAGIGRLLLQTGRSLQKQEDLAEKLADNTDKIETLDRHLGSTMNSWWLMDVKVTTMEEYLHDEMGYRPPHLGEHGEKD